jgi:hypothetical protein
MHYLLFGIRPECRAKQFGHHNARSQSLGCGLIIDEKRPLRIGHSCLDRFARAANSHRLGTQRYCPLSKLNRTRPLHCKIRNSRMNYSNERKTVQAISPNVCNCSRMQRTAHSIIPPWLIAVAILISGANYNVAQAQDSPKKHRTAVALACGKEIKKQCSGGAVIESEGLPLGPISVLECFRKSQEKFSERCAPLAMNVMRMCDEDVARLCPGVVASPQGNIVGCLTTAKRMVSPQCNAALDAVDLR